MNPTTLLALALALQAAGQGKPPSANSQTLPPVATGKVIPPVPTGLPVKFTAVPPGATAPVAVVDGQPVYAKDVENLLWDSRGAEMVENMITLVMVRREAAKLDIKVSQAEIEKQLREDLAAADERSKSNPQARPPGTSIEELLAKEGFPISRMYLNSEVVVTLDRIAEKTFQPGKFVKVSWMPFRPDGDTPAAISVAEAKAKEAARQLKAGTGKWETVLATSQLPPEYIKTGGLMGWLDVDTFPADVRPKITSLQPGQISDSIKIQVQGTTSFQIFRIEQVGSKAVGADLEQLRIRYVQGQRKPLLDKLRAETKIVRPTLTQSLGTLTPPKK